MQEASDADFMNLNRSVESTSGDQDTDHGLHSLPCIPYELPLPASVRRADALTGETVRARFRQSQSLCARYPAPRQFAFPERRSESGTRWIQLAASPSVRYSRPVLQQESV